MFPRASSPVQPLLALVLLSAVSAPHAFAQSGNGERSSKSADQKPNGQRWRLQYFYDEIGSELQITGLAFPSATHGVAVGAILDRKGTHKPKPTALLTSNAGEQWTPVPLPDTPRSIYFLDEANGWMIGREAIWFTSDTGRTWTKLSNQFRAGKKLGEEGLILRVAFVDPHHGFAVGLEKHVFETDDGGQSWKPVDEAAKPSSNPTFSEYTHIAWATEKRGLIVGGYSPPRKGGEEEPDWVNPERALERRQVPTLTLEMETLDGGMTWTSATAPLIGSIVALSLKGAHGLGVFAYADSFMYPSEVFHFDLQTGKSESSFKQKDRRVTDALVFSDGHGLLAAVEPPGRMASAPIPGKVRFLRSSNLSDWEEMKVDYRAIAGIVTLAASDFEHVWAATDTGMILQLVGSPVPSP